MPAIHYETQPIPNPLSWYLHQLPAWFHKVGALWNHLVELLVPWMAFGPRRVRHVAGLLLIAFQVMLILSGNLSWLNWLTIAVCIACFDDSALGRLFPKAIRTRVRDIAARGTMRSGQRRVIYALTAVILILSIQPTFNMLSTGQIMNTSFDPLRIVNTYGAFGSVGRTRPEIIFSRARTTPSSMTTPCGWSTSSSASQATSTGVHALFRPITTVWIGRSRCCSPRSGRTTSWIHGAVSF